MKQAKVLTQIELQRVLTVAAAGKHGSRNRLALLLSHYAGLRVGEIASLSWSQLLDQRGQIQNSFHLNPEDTKSNEARAVHLNPLLMRELAAFRNTVPRQRPWDQLG